MTAGANRAARSSSKRRSAELRRPGIESCAAIRAELPNEGLNFRNSNNKDLSNGIPQAVTFGTGVAAVGPANVDPKTGWRKLPGISSRL